MNNFRSMAGFTIVELMATILVLAIITAMAVPSFNTMIKNYRMVTMTNDLNGTLQYARAEAVRRGGKVTIEAIGDNVANGLEVKDEDGEVLRQLVIDLAGVSLVADVDGTAKTDLDFAFNARGENDLGNTLALNLCDDRDGNYGRKLEMLVSGAVRLTKDVACTQ